MQHRRHRTVVGRHLASWPSGACITRIGCIPPAPLAAAGEDDVAFDTTLLGHSARSRLHRCLPSWNSRERQAYELLSELNPIRHASDAEAVAKYQVEPYVLAADVYSAGPHVGRGGWTWYTGSASWMYRIGVEWMLGLKRRGDELAIDPCIPPTWDRFEVDYRTEAGGVLSIVFENPEGVSHGVAELWLDERALPSPRVPLPRAGERKHLRVRLGTKASASRPPTSHPASTEREGQRLSGLGEPH
jgi:hypothetical protein